MASGTIYQRTNNVYVERKGTTGNVANNGSIVSLTLDAGKYLVSFYANNTAWVGINDVSILDQEDIRFGKVGANTSFVNIMEFTSQTKISLRNNTGSQVSYSASCNIIAIKLI